MRLSVGGDGGRWGCVLRLTKPTGGGGGRGGSTVSVGVPVGELFWFWVSEGERSPAKAGDSVCVCLGVCEQ